MEGIRGLTDKANGNKWLPCQLTNEHTGLGIEPITADKYWHDTQRVCSPLMWPTFLFLSLPKKSWNVKTWSFMHYAFAFWWGHDCAYFTSCMHGRGFVCACTCLCNIHSSTAVMDGVLCCSSGAISQPESRGWPPGYDAPRSRLKARTDTYHCMCVCVMYSCMCLCLCMCNLVFCSKKKKNKK